MNGITSEQKEDSDSEEDPLDAFMADLEKSAKESGLSSGKAEKASTQKTTIAVSEPKSTKTSQKAVRADIDEEDEEESYYRSGIGTVLSIPLMILLLIVHWIKSPWENDYVCSSLNTDGSKRIPTRAGAATAASTRRRPWA